MWLLGACLALAGGLLGDGTGLEARRWSRLERRMAFEEAWQSSKEELRNTVREEVARYRRADPAGVEFTGSARLVRWTQWLTGKWVPEVPNPLEAWVAEWNLTIEPGWMEANPDVPGTELVVHVSTPGRPPGIPKEETKLLVELDWLARGSFLGKARRETVHVSNFDELGFDLFVQPPSSEPGVFWLEPRLLLLDQRLSGFAVPFAVQPGDPDRTIQAEGAPEGWVKAYRNYRATGTRDLTFGPWDRLLEPPQVPWRTGVWEGRDFAVLEPEGEGAPRLRVWILGSDTDLPQGEFMGVRGAFWQPLVDAGAQVVIHPAPLYALEGGTAWQVLKQWSSSDSVPTLLVVRGAEMRELILAQARAPQGGIQGLVVLQAGNPRAKLQAPIPGVPTLFLLASDSRSSVETEPGVRAKPSPDPFAWLEASLGAAIRSNLDLFFEQDPLTGKR